MSAAESAEDQQLAEIHGPDEDAWYGTYILDWIALCDDLQDGDTRGYMVMRSLIFDVKGRRRNPVRILTLAELCQLIPGPNGKPSGLTRVRGMLGRLSTVGLVSTPDNQPLKTSSRAKATGKAMRIKIHDRPYNGYVPKWQNTDDKLDAIRPEAERAAREAAEREASKPASKPAAKDTKDAGRNSDPVTAGRNSDPVGRLSDPVGRNSDPEPAADLQDHGPVFSSHSSSSLSYATGDPSNTPDPAVAAEAETVERETAATPENNPVAKGRTIGEAWAAARSAANLAVPARGAQAVARSATSLLTDGEGFDLLLAAAEDMGRQPRVLTDLGRHLEWFTPPQPASLPSQRNSERTYCGACEDGWTEQLVDGRPRATRCACVTAAQPTAA